MLASWCAAAGWRTADHLCNTDTVAAPMGRVARTGRAADGKAIFRWAATAAVLGGLAACSNSSANGEAEADVPTERTAPDGTVFNDADAIYVRAMVAHHRQSIEIAELASVPANEASEWLPPLAERIKTERLAEIEPLEALLAAWGVAEGAIEQGGEPAGADGEAVDGGDTADTSVTDDEGSASSASSLDDQFIDPTDTPGAQGMMSADEMTDLATTIGGDFDRLWLSMMIRHHEGAIAMSAQLLLDGRNAELRSMAATMSSTYERDVAEMNAALTAVSPPTR